MTKQEKAIELHDKGCNFATAVESGLEAEISFSLHNSSRHRKVKIRRSVET